MIALAPKHSEAIQILASLPKKEVSNVRLAYNGEVVAIVDESTIRALQVAIHDGLTLINSKDHLSVWIVILGKGFKRRVTLS